MKINLTFLVVFLPLKMPGAISELIQSLESETVSKISKQFYETFFENSFPQDSVSIKEEAELSKKEQNDRIILLLLCLAILLSSFAFLPTFILLMHKSTPNSMVTMSAKEYPTVEKKMILYEDGVLIESTLGKCSPILQNRSIHVGGSNNKVYGYSKDNQIYILALNQQVKVLNTNQRGFDILNSKPPIDLDGHEIQNIRYGPGIRIMDYYWMVGFSVYSQFGYFYKFQKGSYLWSISKQQWIDGPKLPYLLGVEEGCLTVLNRTIVLVIGITYLQKFEDIGWQETFWIKQVHGPLGNFGNAEVSNNLIYTYDFSNNYWSEFMELPIQQIQKYTCVTQISKDGQINVDVISQLWTHKVKFTMFVEPNDKIYHWKIDLKKKELVKAVLDVVQFGMLSVHRGILHFYLQRNEASLFGYFTANDKWIPIPFSNMPRQSEDNFEKCTAEKDIASCTNFFFGQVSVID